MPYPEHWLCQFGGEMGIETDEVWTCGIRLVVDAADPTDALDPEQWLTDTGVPALQAFIMHADSHVGNQTSLRFVKMNRIGPDGRYADLVTHEVVLGDGFNGSAGVSVLPYQACVVLTWRTNAGNRGPGTKGRIYLPHPALTVSTGDGLFAIEDAQAIADRGAVLINSLDASTSVLGGTIRPHIVSDRAGGVSNQIDQVTVDNRIDIQRRRANSLSPARASADVSY